MNDVSEQTSHGAAGVSVHSAGMSSSVTGGVIM